MLPKTPLFIYEIRALNPKDLEIFALLSPQALFGLQASFLAGFHFEADFAFLFFTSEVNLDDFFSHYHSLSLRYIHRLRYDQWQDGAESVKLKFGPLTVRVGPGASLAEETQELDFDSSQQAIDIDPLLAFGYGGHPTTKACLEFLLKIYRPKNLPTNPPPAEALDLGCGTGILALAAAKLGAQRVVGIDLSHLAVSASLYNAKRNCLEDKVTILQGLAQNFANYKAPLVMANIPLFTLKDLVALGTFDQRLWLIISGLLT
ncbi:MAG: 50S ribosomal protein L11 methyltransferase [Deltaproteobacteria bacterium]|jgi:ribosomal protein L11 methyltransferase|nr:50S ribosomal protein L11 methyltransferase [Deltaproteobacteria bacterium]